LFSQNLVSAHLNFFGEAWSLAGDEWFYLLAPLMALAAAPAAPAPRQSPAGGSASSRRETAPKAR